MNTDTVTLELLGRQLQRVLDRMNAFDQNIPLQLKAMGAQLDQMDTRLKLFDARFDQQDLKLQRIEESLDAIANRLVQAIADLKKPDRSPF